MVIDNGKNTVEIYADGNNITGGIHEFFQSITVTDKKGISSDALRMVLTDPRQKMAEPETWKTLTVLINGVNLGDFEINEISGDIVTREIEVSGTAIDTQSMLKAKRSRSFEPGPLEKVVKKIAGDSGYTPEIGKAIGSIALEHINQVQQSDLSLLTDLAKKYGGIFKVASRRMVVTNDDATDTSGQPLPTMPINDPTQTDGRWTSTRRNKFKSVKAQWFDETINRPRYEKAGSGDPCDEIKKRFRSQEEAAHAAASKMKEYSKHDKKLSLTMPLNIDYAAGCPAQISNHGPEIDGEWYVEKMEHTVSVSAYDTTSIELVKELKK